MIIRQVIDFEEIDAFNISNMLLEIEGSVPSLLDVDIFKHIKNFITVTALRGKIFYIFGELTDDECIKTYNEVIETIKSSGAKLVNNSSELLDDKLLNPMTFNSGRVLPETDIVWHL